MRGARRSWGTYRTAYSLEPCTIYPMVSHSAVSHSCGCAPKRDHPRPLAVDHQGWFYRPRKGLHDPLPYQAPSASHAPCLGGLGLYFLPLDLYKVLLRTDLGANVVGSISCICFVAMQVGGDGR